MCGIVGYIGERPATPLLVAGLRRLEYRGYDSAGVAVWNDGATRVVRCEGKLSGLEGKLKDEPAHGSVGIGHTRWATHGKPSDANAHPHKVGGVAVVHNGIIENHLALRQELMEAGHEFTSETDTEIFAHLIHGALEGGAKTLTEAVQSSLPKVTGAFAIVAISDADPSTIVAAKNASPLVVGLGESENFVASDVTAILDETRDVIFVEEGEIATVSREGVVLTDFDGKTVDRAPTRITWSATQAEKQGYRHFMLKEIHEQPRAIADTLAGRVDLEGSDVTLDDDLDPSEFDRIQVLGCGTSYHAGLVGEYLVESLARVPTEVDLASEFRYRDPIIDERTLVVAVSQSGETADTMAAIREAKAKGAKILAIANVVGSSIPRLADYVIYTHAGPEIGVASTKAFTTQVVTMAMLAIHIGRRNGKLGQERAAELLAELVALPQKMTDLLGHEAQMQIIARRYGHARGFLFLGRGPEFPIALEGALKLKEISYIHAEGYAAGEMKHGPIALIDDELPVVVIVPRDSHYEKTISNLSEVKARDGKILAIATRGDKEMGGVADEVIMVPDIAPELLPVLTTVPLQLLAYYVADFKGTDIDQPRNLAKSVTVE